MLDLAGNEHDLSPTAKSDVPTKRTYPSLAELRGRGALSGLAAKMAADQDAEEAERLDKHRKRIAERLQDGRSKPVDAVTLEPVTFERPVRRQERLLKTASKFKGTRNIRDMLPMAAEPEPENGAAAVGLDRVTSWRIDAELERARRSVPSVWDAMAVDLWLQAAYETLFRMPARIWPKEYGSCMPEPTDHADLSRFDENAQASNDEKEVPPLFGMARLRALGLPEKYEIERMGSALRWPTVFLSADVTMPRVVGHAAMWKALDISFTENGFRKICKRRFQISPVEFDRVRGAGLVLIAEGLNDNSKRQARSFG